MRICIERDYGGDSGGGFVDGDEDNFFFKYKWPFFDEVA
jgi:hypothetical protein